MSMDGYPSFDGPVGVFPLPNVVLFPRTALPLQVFEPRYQAMVRDALSEDMLMAMALLRPGFEPYYYTNLAKIYPVVCVGRIREYAKTHDGRYFLNLVGLCRARVLEEDRQGEYRTAMLEPMLPTDSGIEVDGEFAARRLVRKILNLPVFNSIEMIERYRAWVDSQASLGEIADFLAFNLLPSEAIEVKQNMLEEVDAIQRANILLGELRILGQMLELRQHRENQWPRWGSVN